MVARLTQGGVQVLWRPLPKPRLTQGGVQVLWKRKAMRLTTGGVQLLHTTTVNVFTCFDFNVFECGSIDPWIYHNDPDGDNTEGTNPSAGGSGFFNRPSGGDFHPCPHVIANSQFEGGIGNANAYIHGALGYRAPEGTLITVRGWGWRESGHDSQLRDTTFQACYGHTFADFLDPSTLCVPPPNIPRSEFEYQHVLAGTQDFTLPSFNLNSSGLFFVTLTDSNMQLGDPPRRMIWSWQVFCELPKAHAYFIDTYPDPNATGTEAA